MSGSISIQMFFALVIISFVIFIKCFALRNVKKNLEVWNPRTVICFMYKWHRAQVAQGFWVVMLIIILLEIFFKMFTLGKIIVYIYTFFYIFLFFIFFIFFTLSQYNLILLKLPGKIGHMESILMNGFVNEYFYNWHVTLNVINHSNCYQA